MNSEGKELRRCLFALKHIFQVRETTTQGTRTIYIIHIITIIPLCACSPAGAHVSRFLKKLFAYIVISNVNSLGHCSGGPYADAQMKICYYIIYTMSTDLCCRRIRIWFTSSSRTTGYDVSSSWDRTSTKTIKITF